MGVQITESENQPRWPTNSHNAWHTKVLNTQYKGQKHQTWGKQEDGRLPTRCFKPHYSHHPTTKEMIPLPGVKNGPNHSHRPTAVKPPKNPSSNAAASIVGGGEYVVRSAVRFLRPYYECEHVARTRRFPYRIARDEINKAGRLRVESQSTRRSPSICLWLLRPMCAHSKGGNTMKKANPYLILFPPMSYTLSFCNAVFKLQPSTDYVESTLQHEPYRGSYYTFSKLLTRANNYRNFLCDFF